MLTRALRETRRSVLALALFGAGTWVAAAQSTSTPPASATPAQAVGAAPANALPTNADSANAPPSLPGENAAVDSARAVRGLTLKVSIMTFGASEIVFERFGHDAIEVRDTLTGQDYTYHWGMYDFDDPNFIMRFLTGDANYSMVPTGTAETIRYYTEHNRTIRVQDLALTPVQRAALLEFLVWNSAEQNKFYRYDYYQDNCATRLRDAIDRVLKGQVRAALDTGSTRLTWRSETERVTASSFPVYAGIEMALGRNADQFLTPWRASFMPERLADAVATVILRNENGQRYRLVARDTIVFQAQRVPMPLDPPERLAMAALIGLTVAGLIALLTDARPRILRLVLIVLVTVWYIGGGVLGTALLLAGTATKHAPYMGSNTTLWQIHPILLFAALFVPVALARREATNIARALVAVTALFAVFGTLLQVVPMFRQHSGVVIAVTLPIHLAIAFAVLRMPVVISRRRSVSGA